VVGQHYVAFEALAEPDEPLEDQMHCSPMWQLQIDTMYLHQAMKEPDKAAQFLGNGKGSRRSRNAMVGHHASVQGTTRRPVIPAVLWRMAWQFPTGEVYRGGRRGSTSMEASKKRSTTGDLRTPWRPWSDSFILVMTSSGTPNKLTLSSHTLKLTWS
jgi:hypothetical protein